MGKNLFDVVAVSMKDHTVCLIALNKSKDAAEAFVNMAVMRRGLLDEFFVEVPHDKYKNGDVYTGRN